VCTRRCWLVCQRRWPRRVSRKTSAAPRVCVRGVARLRSTSGGKIAVQLCKACRSRGRRCPSLSRFHVNPDGTTVLRTSTKGRRTTIPPPLRGQSTRGRSGSPPLRCSRSSLPDSLRRTLPSPRPGHGLWFHRTSTRVRPRLSRPRPSGACRRLARLPHRRSNRSTQATTMRLAGRRPTAQATTTRRPAIPSGTASPARATAAAVADTSADVLVQVQPVVAADQFGRLLADHDAGRIGVATDDVWHDAGIGHP
jgi:hypothetical protein